MEEGNKYPVPIDQALRRRIIDESNKDINRYIQFWHFVKNIENLRGEQYGMKYMFHILERYKKAQEAFKYIEAIQKQEAFESSKEKETYIINYLNIKRKLSWLKTLADIYTVKECNIIDNFLQILRKEDIEWDGFNHDNTALRLKRYDFSEDVEIKDILSLDILLLQHRYFILRKAKSV